MVNSNLIKANVRCY